MSCLSRFIISYEDPNALIVIEYPKSSKYLQNHIMPYQIDPKLLDNIQCFSLLFGKCVNWSIDKTIYFSCHYIQSNDSLTTLDANNSWPPHYHKYMYWFFKCSDKCTDIEGFLISLIQIIQAFFICTFDFFQQKCQSLLDLM